MNRGVLVSGIAIGLFGNPAFGYEIDIGISGELTVENCEYGRGGAAETRATLAGLSQIAQFLQGPSLRQLQSSDATISSSSGKTLDSDAVELLQKQSSYIASGQSINDLRYEISQPRIMGSDVCVAVTLIPEPPPSESQGETDAGKISLVTVVVVGQGYPTNERTAQSNAELDAQRRAVSQVVGVWLTEQSAQSSTLSMAIENDDEKTEMSDLVTHQLTSRSDGYIASWRILSVSKLSNNGIEVRIEADVEQDQVIERSNSLIAELGSPTVSVEAAPDLKPYLIDWLNENGINVGADESLQIVGSVSPRSSGSGGRNRRLEMNVFVRDSFGNVYGRWQNNPALISLPDSDTVMSDLLDIHLSTESQTQELSEALEAAFLSIFKRGGLLRQLSLPTANIRDVNEVHKVLSMTAGIRDLSITREGESIKVEMRYPGSSDELASVLSQQIKHIATNQNFAIEAINQTTLRFR